MMRSQGDLAVSREGCETALSMLMRGPIFILLNQITLKGELINIRLIVLTILQRCCSQLQQSHSHRELRHRRSEGSATWHDPCVEQSGLYEMPPGEPVPPLRRT